MVERMDDYPDSDQPPPWTSWIEVRPVLPAPRLRLFCFAHAGGSAAFYRSWQAVLPPDIEVCAVQLPGRGVRVLEPPFRRMDALMEAIADAVAGLLDRPFALFGHSMGSAVAYAAARRLRRMDGGGPEHLFVSARIPPYRGAPLASLHTRSDAGLLDLLHRFGGTHQELLRNPDMVAVMLPMFRADLELLETYRLPPEPRLDCPITVCCGRNDPLYNPEELDGWSVLTKSRFQQRIYPGGHFYLEDQQVNLLSMIAETLSE
jgi:medium-chain acyl-[acyl-carrier-protein] hydrolase